VLLIITFIALLIGCVLLYLEVTSQGLSPFGRVLLPQRALVAEAVAAVSQFIT